MFTRPAPPRVTAGTTLTELLFALVLAGLLLGMLVPGGRRLLDRVAVVSAREELVGLVHRARSLAPGSGGATLSVDLETGSAVLLDGESELRGRLDLEPRGVAISTTGSATVVDLRWNALGWGIVSSRTFVLQRGDAEARVVVSSRGRATRR